MSLELNNLSVKLNATSGPTIKNGPEDRLVMVSLNQALFSHPREKELASLIDAAAAGDMREEIFDLEHHWCVRRG